MSRLEAENLPGNTCRLMDHCLIVMVIQLKKQLAFTTPPQKLEEAHHLQNSFCVCIFHFSPSFMFIIIATRLSISGMKHLLFGLFVKLTIIHSTLLCTNILHTNPFPPIVVQSYFLGVFWCYILTGCQNVSNIIHM